jgi:hypothetical protein
MNTETPLPPQRSSSGCLGKGCIIFIAFVSLLILAFAGGTFWALKRLQNTYSTTTPATFPELTTGWQQSTGDDLEPDTVAPDEAYDIREAPQTAQPRRSRETVAALQSRWRAFEEAADRHQKARIELTDEDINTLFANDPKLRGKAQVSIQENVGHVRVSIPLTDLLGRNADGWAGSLLGVQGRYFNGSATVRPSPDGDPTKAQISNISVADQSVPDTFLDQRFFGFPSVRTLMTDWLEDQAIERFQIRGNQVMAETRGQQRRSR